MNKERQKFNTKMQALIVNMRELLDDAPHSDKLEVVTNHLDDISTTYAEASEEAFCNDATSMSMEEYVDSGATKCPTCSQNTVTGGAIVIHNDGASQECACLSCEACWVSDYTLTGYSQGLAGDGVTELTPRESDEEPEEAGPITPSPETIAMLTMLLEPALESVSVLDAGKWGYGVVDVYAALGEPARAIDEALRAFDDRLPGVPMYDLSAHILPVTPADPKGWLQYITKNAHDLVDYWCKQAQWESEEELQEY